MHSRHDPHYIKGQDAGFAGRQGKRFVGSDLDGLGSIDGRDTDPFAGGGDRGRGGDGDAFGEEVIKR